MGRPLSLLGMGFLLCVIAWTPLCAAPARGVAADSIATRARGRPTVGLVLSGGGARGLAHIGALKVLEELHIPVDYIAGTSAGSIVGALYAVGMSPDEIERAVLEIDWDDLFSDLPRRRQRVFRRKQDDRTDLFDFEFGLRGYRPALPSGAVAGQKLTLAFKSPQIHTTIDQNFDDFPIPFRAVATDINTGEMVVMSKGSLVQAVRASMSVPGVFAPVRWNGRELVDGGLVRNVPADVVKKMGADVIIVIDVGVREREKHDYLSILEVSDLSLNVLIRNNSMEAMKDADMVVPIPLPGVSSADFRRAAEIIAKGEKTTRLYADSLARFSVPEAQYQAFLRRQRRGPGTPWRVDSIEVDNYSRVSDEVIARRVRHQVGKPINYTKLEEDLDRIYGLGMFQVVDFEQVDAPNTDILRIRAFEKPFAPNMIKLGWEYRDDLTGKLESGLLVRYTRLEINRLGGEVRLDVRPGITRGISLEWYQPLHSSRSVFVAPRAEAFHAVQDVYQGRERVAEYQRDGDSYGGDVGCQFGRYGEVRSGLLWGELETSVSALSAGLGGRYKHRGRWVSSLSVDLRNDAAFPTRGLSAQAELTVARAQLGDADHYERLSLDATEFVTVKRNTMFVSFTGGTNLGSTLPFDEKFVAGGPQSFSGLAPWQLRGQLLGIGRLGYYRPLVTGTLLVGTTVYAGGWVEAGNAWESRDDVAMNDVIYAGTLVLGATTILGPVQLGYGRTDRGDDGVFLTVGRQFGRMHSSILNP